MKCTSIFAFLVTIMPTVLVWSQTVDPPNILLGDASLICGDIDTILQNVCITLPPTSTKDKVDVLFLFDDTEDSKDIVDKFSSIYTTLANELQAEVPDVEFGFGVARFEEYGGPGRSFGLDSSEPRPFILNQPIITANDAPSTTTRDNLILAALSREAPGNGGDPPEAALAEGLFQVATGFGFDGNGDGSTNGISNRQFAGSTTTQLNPDSSGDVPAFSSLVRSVRSSGTVGGVGFREDALKLVVLATGTCSIAAFDSTLGSPPKDIIGTFSSEPTTGLLCSSTLGNLRYGYVSDSTSQSSNTIANAVVPEGAATVPETIDALNLAGIRVLGMGPGASPIPIGSGPSEEASNFLSALARLTGAVDNANTELVFDSNLDPTLFKDTIKNSIKASMEKSIDVDLVVTNISPNDFVPNQVTVLYSPSVRNDVGPNEEACFDVTLTGSLNSDLVGDFDLTFQDANTELALGSIPVSVSCIGRVNGNNDPDCSGAYADPSSIWPADNQFYSVFIDGVIDVDGDPVTITVTNIDQDEPVRNRLGEVDARVVSTINGDVVVRAATNILDGRLYFIDFVAEDDNGGLCQGQVTVCVPYDEFDTCLDVGARYPSTVRSTPVRVRTGRRRRHTPRWYRFQSSKASKSKKGRRGGRHRRGGFFKKGGKHKLR